MMYLCVHDTYILSYIYIIVVSIPKHLPVATVLQSYETTQSLRGVSLVRTTTDFGVNAEICLEESWIVQTQQWWVWEYVLKGLVSKQHYSNMFPDWLQDKSS